jgi:hypothetical protein
MKSYLIHTASILIGAVYAVSCFAQPVALSTGTDESSSADANIFGTTRGPAGEALAGAQIIAHALDGDHAAISGDDGAFRVTGLKPGRYELKASKAGFASPPGKTLDLAANESLNANIDFQDSAAKPVAPAHPPPAVRRPNFAVIRPPLPIRHFPLRCGLMAVA